MNRICVQGHFWIRPHGCSCSRRGHCSLHHTEESARQAYRLEYGVSHVWTHSQYRMCCYWLDGYATRVHATLLFSLTFLFVYASIIFYFSAILPPLLYYDLVQRMQSPKSFALNPRQQSLGTNTATKSHQMHLLNAWPTLIKYTPNALQ